MYYNRKKQADFFRLLYTQSLTLCKMRRPHHPDLSFKSAARKRFAEQIHLVDAYPEIQIIALHLEIIDFLAGKTVFLT